MAIISPTPKFQAFDTNGDPLVGGKLFTYSTGTTTKKITYTDETEGASNANPIILDSRGECDLWLGTGAYTLGLYPATEVADPPTGSAVWTINDITGSGGSIGSATTIANLRTLSEGQSEIIVLKGWHAENDGGGGTFYWNEIDTASDDGGLVILPDSSPATGRWNRLYDDVINVKWFGAKGDGTTDDTAEITSAIGAITTGTILMPKGSYLLSSAVTFTDSQNLIMHEGANFLAGSAITVNINGNFEKTIDTAFGANITAVITGAELFEIYPQWWGAIANGVADDTDAINAAFLSINTTGGTIVFPYTSTSYLINGAVGAFVGDAFIRVLGNNSKLKQAVTGSGYNMFSFRKNMYVQGMELEGYIASGAGSTALPANGFGFRSSQSATAELENVTFQNCKCHDVTFDGWYISDDLPSVETPDAISVKAIDCEGYDNHRNDFVAVACNHVILDGGSWGNDSSAHAGKVNAIDFESNVGQTINKAVAKNLICYHNLNFFAGNGTSIFGEASGITMNGLIYGATECKFAWLRFHTMIIGQINFLNSATFGLMGAFSSSTGVGRFETLDIENGPNLIEYPYNTIETWTDFSSGTPTREQNVVVGDSRGIRQENSATGQNNLSVNVSATANTIYSFGGKILSSVGAGSNSGIWVRETPSNETYYLQPSTVNEVENICAAFKTQSDTTSLTLSYGSDTTLTYDYTISELYLTKGLHSNIPIEKKTFIATTAPAAGTWNITDIVYKQTALANNNDYFMCTASGTPGTWEAKSIGPTLGGGTRFLKINSGEARIDVQDTSATSGQQRVSHVATSQFYRIQKVTDGGSFTSNIFNINLSNLDVGVDGNLSFTVAGKGVKILEGSNAKMGTASLSSGVQTVLTSAVSTNSRIFITPTSAGSNVIYESSINDGVSFSVSDGTGSSFKSFNWLIIDPV